MCQIRNIFLLVIIIGYRQKRMESLLRPNQYQSYQKADKIQESQILWKTTGINQTSKPTNSILTVRRKTSQEAEQYQKANKNILMDVCNVQRWCVENFKYTYFKTIKAWDCAIFFQNRVEWQHLSHFSLSLSLWTKPSANDPRAGAL